MRDNVEFVNSLYQIRDTIDSMSKTQKVIASFVLNNPSAVITGTLHSLAAVIGVSEGSVINFANMLGFDGYTALKMNIAQCIHPQSVQNDKVLGAEPGSAVDVLKSTVDSLTQAFRVTCEIQNEAQMQKAAEILINARNIDVYGVTSSAILAEDAAYRLMKLGFFAKAMTDPIRCPVSALMLTNQDAVLAISASGRTHDLVRSLQIAREQGAAIIGITGLASSPVAQNCDALLLTGSGGVVNNFSQNPRIVQMLLVEALCQYIAVRCSERTREYQRRIDQVWQEYYQK